jgi:hypothetical protein
MASRWSSFLRYFSSTTGSSPAALLLLLLGPIRIPNICNHPTHLHSIFNNVKKLQGFGYPQIWDSGSELLGMMMMMTIIPPKL